VTEKDNAIVGRDFKMLILNLGLSRIGTSAFNLVIIWVILYETKSAFLAGLGDGIISLPLFFSFLVGAIVDSTRHKKFLAYAGSFLRAVFLTTVLIGFYFNNLSLILISIYSSGFIVGFTSDILNSIRASWTKQFLDEESYKKGSSLQNSVSAMAEGVGFMASGGFLILGFAKSFVAIIVVFLIALVPLFLMKPTEIEEKKGAIQSVKEGFAFIRKTAALMEVIVIGLITNLVFGMSSIVFIALIQVKLNLPSFYVSVVFSLLILGIIIGSGIAPRFKGKLGKMSSFPFLFLGVSVLSVSFTGNIFLVMVPDFIIGLLIGLINVFMSTAFLKIIPTEMMARVNGAFNTFALGATFSSGMIGGTIIQLTSISTTFLILGGAVIAVTPLWLVFKELYSITI
jgi:MFS family permease